MSGSTAKYDRREIKRAFGPAAIQTLDNQAAAIAQLSDDAREAIKQQNETIQSVREAHALAQDRLLALIHELSVVQFEFEEHRNKYDLLKIDFDAKQETFLRRLRWLVTGR